MYYASVINKMIYWVIQNLVLYTPCNFHECRSLALELWWLTGVNISTHQLWQMYTL